MFCISMEPTHLKRIKILKYLPVGLGNNKFSDEWFKDNTSNNISSKNKNYGEYTFHYWLWKNYLDKIGENWIGFCQYRKFWSLKENNLILNSFSSLESIALKEVPNSYQEFDAILGEETFINQFRPMKFLKRGFRFMLKNPSFFIDKRKRNLKFHFDFWHGEGNLNKAINLLDKENKEDFRTFVNSKFSFNPHNMFLCKSTKILNKYYSTIFPWLDRCEKEFGFNELTGYGKTRIYGFLAERFLSYWFQKNLRIKTMPIIYYDIGKDII